MARFGYTATDRDGELRTGQIEASGLEDARSKIAAMGLRAEDAAIETIAEDTGAGGRLSSAAAARVGGQVADLARAQLPLGPGLRAMAEEFPRGPAPRVLRRLGDRIDAGMSLEDALAAEGPRVPEHLRYMLTAAVRSGRFAEVIDEMVAMERVRLDVRQRLRLSFAYPFLLLALAYVAYVLCVFIVPSFGKIFLEFGTELPLVTKVVLQVCSPPAGIAVLATCGVLAAVVIVAMGGRSRVPWMQRMLYLVPIVGPIWRFRGLAEFSRLTGLLVDLQVPLPQALHAVGGGLREGDLRAAAGVLSEEVAAGVPLSEAMARVRAFPASFMPLVQWGEKAQGGEKAPPLADAFRGTAEMCEGRLRFQGLFASAVILPITVLAVLFFVGVLIVSLFLPLISLVQKLS